MSVSRPVKWTTFVASVITLSWFFAGWRGVIESGHISEIWILLAGVVCTAVLLVLQGYWVYSEEKAKGKLGKRIALFEAIEAYLAARQSGRVMNKTEGDCTRNEA